MAYKIQVGTARMGGSVKYEGAINAGDGSHLSGSDVSASTDINIAGPASANADAIDIQAGGALVAAASASFTQTGQWFVLDSLSSQGRARFKVDAAGGSNTELAKFYASSNAGALSLNTTGSDTAKVTVLSGVLSGSVVALGGNLTIAGSNNLTVAGTLKVDSGKTNLDVATFTTTDQLIELAVASPGNGNNAGLAFGLTGSNGSGATLKFDKANTEIDVADGNGNLIPLSASVFYGNGSGLTGLGSVNPVLSVSAVADGGTLSLGFNRATGAGTLNLPAASSLTDGDEITVKRVDSNSANLTIDAAGSDTIDGEGTIILESANAAVTLVLSGSSFKVF